MSAFFRETSEEAFLFLAFKAWCYFKYQLAISISQTANTILSDPSRLQGWKAGF